MAARYPPQHISRPARSSSRPSTSKSSDVERHPEPHPAPPADEYVKTFEACATTATFFLYAQQNLILSLHHDTLAVDRRFDKHRDEVLMIVADNVSDRGAGRLVVSYDASQTAIVWDLFTGSEVARFASYETIKAAAWMRDGAIAFGGFHTIASEDHAPSMPLTLAQVTRKVQSYSSTRKHRSTSILVLSSTPLLLWRRLLTVEPLPLGTPLI